MSNDFTGLTLTWNEFLKDATEFYEISKKLGDSWTLEKKNENEANTYLSYKKKLKIYASTVVMPIEQELVDQIEIIDDATASSTHKTEVIQMDYHVIYSISYQVPMLYLQAQRSDGSLLELEDIWRIFQTYETNNISFKSREFMLNILTPMEHPILYKPTYAIHPCRTAALLEQTPSSCNRVLTFISLMGPYVQLCLDNRYGLAQEVNVSKHEIQVDVE